MNNKVMELAIALGQAIKEDERIKKMEAAKVAFDTDKEIQSLMLEYNTQRVALGEEYKKETQDKEFIDVINKRIEELYNSIITNEIFIAYNATQDEVNKFMNEVNGEITFQITGERPCTHDCSSCHSDCGHHHH
ncbi:MAG: YlbF family regulator [Clostridia bacterium]|nr:YlbF family regulator [Clostridia bacterium]